MTHLAPAGHHQSWAPPADPAAAARVRRLTELGLGPVPRADFDEAAAAFGRAVGAAGAFINLLGDRQFFAGLYLAPRGDLPQIDRTMNLADGYCPALIPRNGKALVLTDVHDHPRFQSNRVVDQLGARSYVGAPFVDPVTGLTLATVCFIDVVPRPQSSEQDLLQLVKARRDALATQLFPALPR
ncbi:GAF domain-containing protein [Streptomyces sp. NPDC001889]